MPTCTWSTSFATAASRSSSRSPGSTTADPGALREAFEDEHEERYGYRDADQELELVTIRVTATGPGVDVELAGDDAEPDVERSTREATLDGERIELEVLRGIPSAGTKLDGPAVIELPESTVLIPPGWTSAVDDAGTIHMRRSG